MVKGIGIDIVDVEKFRRAYERWKESFLERIFMSEETEYCFIKKDPCQHLAARFACKEAVIKALGENIGFKKIRINNLKTGKPYCLIEDKRFEGFRAMVSLSHLERYATAVAVLVKET